ncbi:GtrA family protein [Escherichia coli]|nr:GtrA family protein [Escherichia coli]
MLKLFAKYTSIGVLNTLIHWVVFGVCVYAAHTNQALANFAGFVVAVSFSFFANAKFTFKASTTTMRYMLYVVVKQTRNHVNGAICFFFNDFILFLWEFDEVTIGD